MNEQVKKFLRIIAACCVLALGWKFQEVRMYLAISAWLIAGYDVLLEAWEEIREREIFGECFLMSIATIGALILGEYTEACAVMILYQIGELFGDYASDKSRDTITKLVDLRPEYAYIETEGSPARVMPSEIAKGSVIVVRPGEKVPIDGVIIDGHSAVDTRAITGESLPRDVNPDDEILSGCVNLSGVLRIRTTKEFQDSAVSKILDLVENAQERKAKAENFITRFARVYTPLVCVCALVLAIVPPILGKGKFTLWLYRALSFLVISCPCALVISVPLTFFAALGRAGKAGILIKGSNFIEALTRIKCLVFDKTGTLTQGVFEVVAVHPEVLDENELLHLAAHVERYSTHPAAEALRRAYPDEADECTVEDAEELAGLGVKARVNGKIICVGNSKLMDSVNAKWHPCTKSSGTVIHVSVDGEYAGHIVISDVVKVSSREAVSELRRLGITRIAMFTGDTEASAESAALSVGINEVYSELLPADKAELLGNMGGTCAFVGDGINDAPVIARADVGFAMGGLGSDAAIEAADVVLTNDDPMKVAEAVRISRKCMGIVWQNIILSIGVKIACMILVGLGHAGMPLAVFADVGVMVLAVLNALRAMM